MAEEMKEVPVQERSDDAKAQQQNAQAQLSALMQQLAVAQTIATKERNRSEELANLVNRMHADFDNYRKRNAELN